MAARKPVSTIELSTANSGPRTRASRRAQAGKAESHYEHSWHSHTRRRLAQPVQKNFQLLSPVDRSEQAAAMALLTNVPARASVPEVESQASNSTEWFALSVTVRHEKVVSQLLRNKGFEVFLPLYTRRHRYERRVRAFELPLLPGYVFCRTDLSTRAPIVTTPGVLRIVGAGKTPIPVDRDEIRYLQKAAEAGAAMAPHAFWQSGQRGRIVRGPLTGIEGTVIEAKHCMRLVLSVSLLQRSVLLEIDSDCVVLLESPICIASHA